jgi:biofilm PGA synthesis protein PgaA
LKLANRSADWVLSTFAVSVLMGSFTASAAGLSEYNAIIESARAGAHAQAVTALQSWSSPEPSTKKVTSDLTVILRWAGRDAEALALAKKTGIAGLEAYALKSAAVAARNLQDAPWAVSAYAGLVEADPKDCDARLGLALSSTDAGQSDKASTVLETLEKDCTPAGGPYSQSIAQARSYWAARQVNTGQPQELLALGWWTERLGRDGLAPPWPAGYQTQALREAALLASRNGAHQLARRWLQGGEAALTGEDTARILSAQAAQQIRWAKATPDDARADWQALLVNALDNLKLAKALTTDQVLLSLMTSDTIAALSERGDGLQTLKEVELADAAGFKLLPYAEVAAADALMRDNRPHAAEIRLRAALQRLQGTNEFDQRELSISLFYALVDQGKFAEAKRWMNERAALVPAFSNRDLPGVQAEDDAFVRFQLARASLLSSSLDGRGFNASRGMISNLLRDAPFNTDIRLNDAEWFQARGWPRAAGQATELVLADKPDNTRALDVAARQALDRGDFAGFKTYQREMQRLQAHPQMQERLQSAADRQTGAVFSGDVVRGVGQATDLISGSSDREAALMLMSPIYQNRWRLKTRWRSSDAQFGLDDPNVRFFAAGARFYWPYFWVEAEAVRRSEGKAQTGLRVAGQWQVVDGLSAYAAVASRAEELPLRGQAAGVSATSAQLSLDWRALPQTYLGFGLNGFNATDGNRQRGISAYADQAYTLADHWRANLRFDISRASNRRNDVAYFSPLESDSYALSAAVAQDLVTAGQTGWTHKLAVSAGEVAQQGFDRGGSYSVSYEHEWRLGSYRTLAAAIGESRRPYDGVQSRRKTISLRWSVAL